MKSALLVISILGLVGALTIDRHFPPTSAAEALVAENELISAGRAVPTNPFQSDGCTLFPDKIMFLDLRPACLEHDRAYWAGGTAEEKVEADTKFKDSITEQGLLGLMVGPIAYFGVMVFGDTWLTKLFDANWGFGWNK